jgi:cytochrome c oxidase cbb3-type subunit II
VPESIMPPYAFLAETELKVDDIKAHLVANRRVGVPYTDAMLDAAIEDLAAQANPEADTTELLKRYPKAVAANFDGKSAVTEMDALVAYLQMLGTLVDFTAYEPVKNER